MADPDTFDQAVARAQRRRRTGPIATGAHYDPRADRIVIRLGPDSEFSFAPKLAQGLEKATPSELDMIEVTPSGLGLHFPKIDADLYLPALLEGIFGSKRWAAAQMGASGGQAKGGSKAAASRSNGTLGGRPRKIAAA